MTHGGSGLPLLFGRFVRVRVLPGASARAERVVAYDLETSGEVTLALFRGDAHQARRFLSECTLAREVAHPNLAPLLLSGQGGEVVFVAHPLGAGLPVTSLLALGSPPLEVALHLAMHAADALRQMHARGLVHGDVTPSRLRLTPGGELRLDGFFPSPGRRACLGADPAARRPRLEPPEWSPDQPLTAAGDVYGFGLVLMSLLTGQVPLDPGTAAEVDGARLMLAMRLATPDHEIEGVPDPLRRVLSAALTPDPRDRPASMVEVVPMLEAAWADCGLRPPEASELARRLRPLARSEQSQMLRDVRQNLDRAEPLLASTGLVMAASLGLRERDREVFLDIARECLWRTLLDGPIPPQRVVADQVRRLAGSLGGELLEKLARRRLESLGGPSPPPPLPTENREAIRRALLRMPGDENYLLALAVHRPEVAAGAADADEARAAIATAEGLPVTALLYRAAAFRARTPDPAALAELAELVQQATGASSGGPGPGEAPLAHLTGPLPAPAPRSGPVDPQAALTMLDDARALLEAGELEPATALILQAHAAGAVEVARGYSVLRELLLRFLWEAARQRGLDGVDRWLEQVLRVARSLGWHHLVSVGERLLVSALPEDDRGRRVAQLLEATPQSVPLLEAACRAAAATGDEDRWAFHLAAAGDHFLEVGELFPATKMYMALRALRPDSYASTRGMAKVFQRAEQITAAEREFRHLLGILTSSSATLARGLKVCEEFLSRYPHHPAALEQAAELYSRTGDVAQASQILLRLARRALHRADPGRARALLRNLLRLDMANDDALLYLAILDPERRRDDRPLPLYRADLLAREGLYPAAIHHARQALVGGPEDLSLLEHISELARAGGADPGAPLLEAARVALGADLGHAQALAARAWEVTTRPAALAEEVLAMAEARQLFPDPRPLEEARQQAATEAALRLLTQEAAQAAATQ